MLKLVLKKVGGGCVRACLWFILIPGLLGVLNGAWSGRCWSLGEWSVHQQPLESLCCSRAWGMKQIGACLEGLPLASSRKELGLTEWLQRGPSRMDFDLLSGPTQWVLTVLSV